MKSSKELKEDRNEILKKLDALVNKAETENRQFTDAEKTEFSNLEAQAENLRSDIEMQVKIEKRKEEKAAANFAISTQKRNKNGEDGEKSTLAKKYSIIGAIRSQLPNNKLEGIEAEMHQEAIKEARASGLKIEGVGMPSFLKESRDLVVGTATAGGNTVATDLGGLIPVLRPQLQTEALGATVLSGLTGNLDLPRNNAAGAATWEGEQDENAETVQGFDKISLTPNRLGAKTHISKQLLAQSSISVEQFVRNDLNMAVRIAVDAAAINGSGSGNVPEGILNVTGIGDVAGGTNGLVPTFEHIVDLETAVAVDNADMGALAYLTTPGIRGALKKAKTDAGSGLFVWGQDAATLNGYRAAVSTQVPSDLVKGSSSDAHAIIFGNWNDLIMASWGGFDIVVDPYTLATQATVRVIVNSWWDMAVRHPESFAAMKDALTS